MSHNGSIAKRKAFHTAFACDIAFRPWKNRVFRHKNIQAKVRKVVSVQVLVRDNNIEQALRALKKKLQREGVFREMKLRREYEKPSVKKARERSESARRSRKVERKRREREGI